MSDKDREAFEKWAESTHNLKYIGLRYAYDTTQQAWRGWQAARDRYIPKLTKSEAVEIVSGLQANGWDYGTHPKDKASIVIATLSAAGMQFKESTIIEAEEAYDTL